MARRSILIVDDDPGLRRTLSDVLRVKGYAATAIAQGRAALAWAEREMPGVALIDLKLEDMPGLELVREIKRHCPATECIVLTGYASQASAIEAVNLGAYGSVQKPYDIEQLLIMIRRAIEKREAEAVLRESEEKYRTLVERANDGIAIVQDTVVKYVNPSLAEIAGYTTEELIGIPFADYVHPDDLHMVVDRYKRRMAGEDVTPVYEITVRRKDGSKAYVEINAGIITYQGKPAELVIVRDLTERKQAEEMLHALNAAAAAIQQAARTPEAVFVAVMEQLQALGLTGAVVLLDEEREQFIIRYTALASGVLAQAEKLVGFKAMDYTFPVKQLPLGRRILAGETIFVSDVAALLAPVVPVLVRPLMPTAMRLLGMPRGVVAPLAAEGQIIGFLGISADRMTEADMPMFTAFANQAAIALENARLYQAERRHADRLKAIGEVGWQITALRELDPLLDRIVSLIHEAFNYRYVTILLVDPARGELAFRAGTGYDAEPPKTLRLRVGEESICGWVAASGEPLLVDDVSQEPRYYSLEALSGTRSELAVPIQAKGRVVGVLDVQSAELKAFDEEDVFTLQTLANEVGVAIENARLFEAEREQRELAKALEEAAAAVSSTLDPDQVLDRILEQVARVVAGDAFNIMLIENSRARAVRWRGYAHLGVAERIASFTLPLSEYPNLAKMVQTGEPVIIPDTAADPDWVPQEGWEWLRSYAGTPIRVDGVAVGILNVDSTRPGQFGPADAPRLRAFADHAAAAIKNARLFRETQRRLQEVMLLSRVIAHTAAAEDVPGALEAVCAELARFFGVPQARFARLNPEHTAAEVIAGYQTAGRPSALGARIPVAGNPSMTYVLAHKAPLAVIDAQADPRLAPVHELMRQQGVASILIVPIESRGEVVGTLGLDSLQRREFSAAEVALAQDVASQVGQVLERLRLFQEARAHAERMARLAAVGETLTLPLDVARTINAIGEGALALCEADRTAIYMRNADGTVSCPWAHRLAPAYVAEVCRRVREVPGGRLLAEQAPVVVADTASLPADALVRELARAAGYRAVALWPLVYEGRTMAAVGCYTDVPRTWSQAEQEVMQAFARQAAVALENARLYESLQAALRARDEMIQNVSHELRTPLTTISGYVELLAEAALGPVTAEQAQALRVMSGQAKRLYFMVNRLLTLQTIDARVLEKMKVGPGLLLCQAVEAWQVRGAEAGIRFELDVAPDIPFVEVDTDLINQVFDNLLDNAVKFSPEEGVVRVRAWVEGAAAPSTHQVLISIADPGIGIPPDKLEHVFERFYQADGSTTRRFGGAGIGLALCRKIVAAHGGRIWAESDGVGRGSTFYVALPASASEPVIENLADLSQ